MSDITAAFYKSVQRTDDVYSFLFKPAENFGFIPGQFLQVIFDEENRNNKELNKYTAKSILDQLEEDIEGWDSIV